MENKFDKIMHYANFNITFGAENEPMLSYFEDIILPAFNSGYKRVKVIDGKEDFPKFSFSDIELKCIDGVYVLVGNYIKETEYNILSQIKGGKLTSVNSLVPAAPYSRFIIFLDNHKMILVRNQIASPDIRSFQKTFMECINGFIRVNNKSIPKGSSALPHASVHIVDMPKSDDIDCMFSKVKKIRKVNLSFYPLNNDEYHLPLFENLTETRKSICSNTGSVSFNSPKSKSGVKELMNNANGLVKTSVYVETYDGGKEKITPETVVTTRNVTVSGDLTDKSDEYLFSVARNSNVMSEVSSSNKKIYDRVKKTLMKFIKIK